MNDNRRETGARKPVPTGPEHRTDQDAALMPSPKPFGLTQPTGEDDGKERHSDAANPRGTAAAD